MSDAVRGNEGRFRLSLGLVPGDGVCGWAIVKRASGCFSLVGSGAFRLPEAVDVKYLRSLAGGVDKLLSSHDGINGVCLQTWPLGTGDPFIKSTFEEGWQLGEAALSPGGEDVPLAGRVGRFQKAFETGLFSGVLAAPARARDIPVSIHSAGVLALMVERAVFEESGSEVFPVACQRYWGDLRRFVAVSLSVSIGDIKKVPEVERALLVAMAGDLRRYEDSGVDLNLTDGGVFILECAHGGFHE